MPHETITDADFRRLTKAPSPGRYLLFGDEDYLKAHSVEPSYGSRRPATGTRAIGDSDA